MWETGAPESEAPYEKRSIAGGDQRKVVVLPASSGVLDDQLESSRYRRECLEPLELAIEANEMEGSLISAHLTAQSVGARVHSTVDHYLLRLPRR